MNTWTTDITHYQLNALLLKIKEGEKYLSFRQVFERWQSANDFRDFYIKVLQSVEYDAYFWEHPPLTMDDLDEHYEFILHKSNGLNQRAVDTRSFADFIHQDKLVTAFPNLGNNAYLVVPTLQGEVDNYRHLAQFVRTVNANQSHSLLIKIADLIVAEIEQHGTIWLSTSGLGVIWLHVRMDIRPKYYQTKAYRREDFWK